MIPRRISGWPRLWSTRNCKQSEESGRRMKKIRVVDVTLRDGGCVNDFCFGQEYMEQILAAQEAAGIDVIELGYIDEARGSLSGRTQYRNERVISQCLLKQKKPGTLYVAMMDYGKFSPEALKPRDERGIDGVRMAFHKENRFRAIEAGRKILDRGYRFYIQPMAVARYDERELLELLDAVDRELPDASGFYIVDSFGEMRPDDVQRLLTLADRRLIPSMPVGLHSHNNLQLSCSNALAMLQYPTERELLLDASIMGMGKGAGNLNTELLLEHLNRYYGKSYSILPLLNVVDRVMNQLYSEYGWGYAPEYYLSAVNHCTPSYASHFYRKHMLSIQQVGELLATLAPEKRISFDARYAEEIYRRYNESKSVDDGEGVRKLREAFAGKKILLVAPGQSVAGAMKRLERLAGGQNTIAIGLNTLFDFLPYALITRQDMYQAALAAGKKTIVPSSVSQESRENVTILNYADWIEADEETRDSSFTVCMKLMEACGVKEIALAGFDGFSADVNANYLDPNMRRTINGEQAKKRNDYFRNLVERARRSGTTVSFLTPSRYDKPIPGASGEGRD